MFETDKDVRNYAERVNAQVNGLERDIRAYHVRKWGPNELAATVTGATPAETRAKLADKKADYDFYHSWQDWRLTWEAEYAYIQDKWFFVNSADEYRRVGTYDVDSKAWAEKFKGHNVVVTAPPITDQGPIPGVLGPTNPDAPGYEPGSTSIAGFNLGKYGGDAIKIALLAGVGLIGFKVVSSLIPGSSR
jgi:hypothetical protein